MSGATRTVWNLDSVSGLLTSKCYADHRGAELHPPEQRRDQSGAVHREGVMQSTPFRIRRDFALAGFRLAG